MPKQYQQKHPFLVQLLFRYLGPMPQTCEAKGHSQIHPELLPAEWQIRFFLNTERVVELYTQQVPEDQIAQRLWDEMCHEQDTVGVVLHRTMYVCRDCARVVIEQYGGMAVAFMATTTAMVTSGATILVADRLTEKAGVLGNVPGDIHEQDILPLLDAQDMLDIRFT